MGKYQASVGLNLYYDTTSDMSNKKFIDGVTDTPDKGGEPADITLNIISSRRVHHIPGQEDDGGFLEYAFAPDYTPTTGNLAVLYAALAASKSADIWIYEEYTEGTDTVSGETVTHTLGAGYLYKGRIAKILPGGQSGNNAQSSRFYVQLTGETIYECSGGSNPTYIDTDTGLAATPV